MNRTGTCAVIISLALISSGYQAAAAPITISGSQGSLAASVTFDTVGSSLKVTLTNTSPSDVMAPADVLTAVFFTVTAPAIPALTPVSAIIGATSTVLFGGTDPGGVVGGEWGYDTNLHNAPHNAKSGISSSGLNWFGAASFPGSNLQGPAGLDGLQYGITSAGDDAATGNQAVTGSNALIKNQVVFMFSGLPAGFDPSTRITDVSFQYGTAANEPNFQPEPTVAGALIVTGLLIIPKTRRRPSISRS